MAFYDCVRTLGNGYKFELKHVEIGTNRYVSKILVKKVKY